MRLTCAFFVFLFALPALAAAPPERLGQSGHWGAFMTKEGKRDRTCFIAAPPVSMDGKYKKRDPVFILITHRTSDRTRNVVSYIAGYAYDEKKAVTADVDGTGFIMVPSGDSAWTPNQKADDDLTEALRDGKKLTVTGFSRKGTKTVDRYDLRGTSKALDSIDKACGVGS